jgi:hypothetical protein
MKNKTKWRRWTVAAGGLLLAATLLVRPYIWMRLPGAVVSLDGHPTSGTAVYRSSTGDLLVRLPDGDGATPYIIGPSARHVRVPNGSSVDWLVTRYFVISREPQPHGVSLQSPKFDIDPHLVFAPGRVEFSAEELTSREGPPSSRRVCVQF